MNIDTLKTFCDLIDTGSFTKTAEINGVSQSAVSQQLSKLEKHFQTQLIFRGGGIVCPTEAGKTLRRGAAEIVRKFETLSGEILSAANSIRGVVRIGITYSLGPTFLAPYMRKFLQSNPQVSLFMEYAHWNRIYAAVISGEMDLGVIACPEKHRSLEVTNIANEELVLAHSLQHRLAQCTAIRAEDIANEKFIAFAKSIPTRRHFDKLLKQAGVTPKVVMEFDNLELVKQAVEVDMGVSILPIKEVENSAMGKVGYKSLADKIKWQRPVGVIRKRGVSISPAIKTFLNILRSTTNESDKTHRPA